jgi:hypothetical protein
MDGKLKSIHGTWIPAIHAGMTTLDCVMMKSDKVELPLSFKGNSAATENRISAELYGTSTGDSQNHCASLEYRRGRLAFV